MLHRITTLLTRRLSFLGVFVAISLLSVSLSPSLLPRSWHLQSVASGLSLVLGYGLGSFFMWIWRLLGIPELSGKRLLITQRFSLAFALVELVYVSTQTGKWQNRIRALAGLEPTTSTRLFRILLISVILAFLLLIAARLVRVATSRLIAFVGRYLPEKVATGVGLILIAWLAGFLVTGNLVRVGLSAANFATSVSDAGIKEGTVRPASPLRSGSSQSMVAWDDLGRQGRWFVGSGPTAADIERFAPNAMEPIRIYAGLKSGQTHQERAELVLQEMIRTDAFDRSIVLIATPTGTGFLESNATETFEYVHGGDTAIVSQQYSHLPSWLSLLSEKQAAQDSAIALFNEVHDYWRDLDEEERPELYLYGLSLGAYGSQASISRVELLNDPVDGALWVGPPFVSEFWNRITDDRDPGSPAWLPIYQDGEVIRFTDSTNDLGDHDSEWQDNRIIYLQNASDPIVFFSYDTLYREPDWLIGERGPDVTQDMEWYPLVTFWQLTFDFISANNTPEDFGHFYSKASYIDSWAALTEPAGWTQLRAEQLDLLLSPPAIDD